MLGRFLEIGIATQDIRASVEFYERLGFTHAQTGDVWPHPYGLLTDGRACIGLHASRLDSPTLTFVRPDVAGLVTVLEQLGIELVTVRTGSEVFNEVGFRDPAGQAVRLLEARTYSPADRSALEASCCGQFCGLSMPATDVESVRHFWEMLGFVADEEAVPPYLHVILKSETIGLAVHPPQFFPQPLLMFRDREMAARIARLGNLGIGSITPPPRGLRPRTNALLRAPEGTTMLLSCLDDC